MSTQAMLLADVTEMIGRRYGNQRALEFDGRWLTYAELRDRVFASANALASITEPGDRVALLSENRSEYVELYLAAPSAGRIMVPLNYRLTATELQHILRDCSVKVLITSAAHADKAHEASRGTDVERVFCLDDGVLGLEHLNRFIGRFSPSRPGARVDENDTAWIIYTSGTTGSPKGAMLTHRNLFTKLQTLALGGKAVAGQRRLHHFPCFHVATVNLFAQMYIGGAVHLLRKFDPDAVLAAIERERIQATNFAATMLKRVLEHPDLDRRNVTSLVRIGYGASPMPEEILRSGIERLGSIFNQTYGCTEVASSVTMLEAEDHVIRGTDAETRRLRSCGKEMINNRVVVADAEGNEVPDGETGELLVRSESVMKGYWNDEAATASTLRNGWLHTGDIGMRDADGFYYITDRRTDLIISGGENIYPQEIEQVIGRDPRVAEVAVIGHPDPEWGESVCAVVRLKPSHQMNAEEIVALCKTQLASYKKPRSVVLIEEDLPRTPSGKVQRHEVRQRYGALTPKPGDVSGGGT